MNEKFDLNEALKAIKAGAKIEGKDGVLAPLIKQLTEAALEAELESHLSTEIRNRTSGKSSKTMKSSVGEFDLDVPRDRNGSFEPQLVKKHQTHMSDQIEQKILSLYALGNSYSQISEHIEYFYGVSFSKATISAVTDKVIPLLKEWQQRPLESIYPFVWLDAIHYKVKENGKYVSEAVYTILGVKLDGKKEILGLYLSENEGANF
jgi:transposase-like protein